MFVPTSEMAGTYTELKDQYQILTYKLEETVRTLDTLKAWVYDAIYAFNKDVGYDGRSYEAIERLYTQCKLEFEMDNPFNRTHVATVEVSGTVTVQFEAENEDEAQTMMEELFTDEDLTDFLARSSGDANWVSHVTVEQTNVDITVEEE